MIVTAAIATAWTVLAVLTVAVCRAARLGDQARRVSTAHSASRPGPHAARRRHLASSSQTLTDASGLIGLPDGGGNMDESALRPLTRREV